MGTDLAVLGPLADLYRDESVLEILVDRPGRVLVERRGKLEEVSEALMDEASLISLIDALAKLPGIVRLTDGATIEGCLPDGAARFVAVLPPVALQGPCLVIQKMIFKNITWEMLKAYRCINSAGFDLLLRAVQAEENILVVGGKASGKTTVLNRLAELIPAERRVIVVEERHEYQIDHPRLLYLEARHGLADVLHVASMMRPDWLVVGELLGGEALKALELLGRGYSGMTTLHANSVEDGLRRIEVMCLQGNPGLGLDEIRGMVSAAVRWVLVQQRLNSGVRRVMQISELQGVEDGRYVLRPWLRYNVEIDELLPPGVSCV